MDYIKYPNNILSLDSNIFKFKFKVKLDDSKFDIIINDLNAFIKNLFTKNLLQDKVCIKVYEGYNRCLARLYDHSNFNKLPNINKRCSKYAVGGYDLCCLHNKIEKTKDWHLRVTEYPDQIRTIHEYQLRDYFENDRDKISEIYDSINLNHKLIQKRYITTIYLDGNNIYLNNLDKNKKLKTKNNINNNSRMSQMIESFYDNLELYELTKEQYHSKLENYINQFCSINVDYDNETKLKEISKDFLKTIDINSPNTLEVIAVSEGLRNRVQKYIKPKKEIKTMNISSLDSIKLINEFRQFHLFIYIENDIKYLYNSNKKNIGILRDWIDEDGEVPEEFKINNIVIHPETNMPILEVEITTNGSAFESIESGIYREYEYEEDLESFRNTRIIYLNN